MNRSAEAAFLIGAAALAAFGVAMANLAEGGGIDAQVALTFLVFLIAFGSLHLALRQWAPRASAYLLPLVSIITAVGLTITASRPRSIAARTRCSPWAFERSYTG